MIDQICKAAYLLGHDFNIGHGKIVLKREKAGPHEKFERVAEIA